MQRRCELPILLTVQSTLPWLRLEVGGGGLSTSLPYLFATISLYPLAGLLARSSEKAVLRCQ